MATRARKLESVQSEGTDDPWAGEDDAYDSVYPNVEEHARFVRGLLVGSGLAIAFWTLLVLGVLALR